MTTATKSQFSVLLKQWREHRHISQLDLALTAGISQRHISYLETGRSRPSRDMILLLAETLHIPLRDTNRLLVTAGYSTAYNESTLEDTRMAPVMEAVRHMLDHHAPFPAVAVDRYWNVRKTNTAADMLLAMLGDISELVDPASDQHMVNLALMTVHPKGLRQYITNWEQASPAFLLRLKRDVAETPDSVLKHRFQAIVDLIGPIDDMADAEKDLLPVLPIDLNINGLELSLFTVISTFGTPQDVTTDELRIELFYPMNKQTEDFFVMAQ